MDKGPFKVSSWLSSTQNGSNDSFDQQQTLDLPPLPEKPNGFTPTQYFVPGWKGDALLSSDSVAIQKFQDLLISDALSELAHFESRNKSAKLHTYNEFLSFLNTYNLFALKVQSFSDFWQAFNNPHSPDKALIDQFKKLYCFRSVSIYLFKVRFVLKLARELNINCNQNNILNPNSFIRNIFKHGSSREISCAALKPGYYNWFRPSSSFVYEVESITNALERISVSELLKICNDELKFSLNTAKVENEEKFSHTLSHKSFGLFLNHLLIHFLKDEKSTASANELNFLSHAFKNSQIPELLTTLFSGDHVTSFGLSHWLAQETNASNEWKQIISPEFSGKNIENGHYLKTCHEIIFITFLAKMSRIQGIDPVYYISSVLNNSQDYKSNNLGQISFFDNETTHYKRIVLNLANMPKKNPHHYLMSQISQNGKNLFPGGQMLVFSNQRLFVPSQATKIDQLLKTYKVEAIFDFEDLTGKGEVPSHIYLFSKRTDHGSSLYSLNQISQTSKESCYKFRWRGEICSFNRFGDFVSELKEFSSKSINFSKTLFQNEMEGGLTFEFHQDAILEGKLLNSITNDDNNITHPNFFKGLTTSCISLDNFFHIENMDQELGHAQKTNDLLGSPISHEHKYPLVLIVNHSSERDIKIELIPSNSYLAKVNEYGNAYFKYFGLIPKRTDINVNVFREFFNQHMGHQIIQLSLSGGDTKIKSKLRSLLVPKFFLETNLIPEHLTARLDFLNQRAKDYVNMHPQELVSKASELLNSLTPIVQKYPWHALCLLSTLKYEVECSLELLNNPQINKDKNVIFNNPLMIEKLTSLNTQDIYPRNEDIYISAFINDPSEIHLPLEEQAIISNDDSVVLEVFSKSKKIIELTSEKPMIEFLNFILTNAKGTPISTILQSLKVPSLTDLKTCLSSVDQVSEEIVSVHTQTQKLISDIFNGQTFQLHSNN